MRRLRFQPALLEEVSLGGFLVGFIRFFLRLVARICGFWFFFSSGNGRSIVDHLFS